MRSLSFNSMPDLYISVCAYRGCVIQDDSCRMCRHSPRESCKHLIRRFMRLYNNNTSTHTYIRVGQNELTLKKRKKVAECARTWMHSRLDTHSSSEYGSLINEMRHAMGRRGQKCLSWFLPVLNSHSQESQLLTHSTCTPSSFRGSHMQAQLTLIQATASAVELHIFTLCLLIAQLPSSLQLVVHSSLSHCLIAVFPRLLYHIPCRDMDNDSLLLTSAELHFAQTCARNLAFAWSNQMYQADIYATAGDFTSAQKRTGSEKHCRSFSSFFPLYF